MPCKKPRMSRMTRYETRWIQRIIEAGLGQPKPFYAKEAVSILFDARRLDGDGMLTNIPNVFRMNTVLKKSKRFERIKDSANSNTWVLKENEA